MRLVQHERTITDIAGFGVGHHTDVEAGTGLTVIVAPEGSTGAADVRGGAPGTRETEMLRPENSVDRVDAILLAGGSAFGLDAAAGVMRWLREQGRGFRIGDAIIPIVPGAVIFDEGARRGLAPDQAAGYRAMQALTYSSCPTGRVGAGTGATVGKTMGFDRAQPGGLGSASVSLPGGVTVAALAVVNALGDVVDAGGRVLAGLTGNALEGTENMILGGQAGGAPMANTTLVVVATDAGLSKAEALRVSIMAGDGLARSIRPVHTPMDGDVVFTVSSGRRRADLLSVGTAAAVAVERAVRDSVCERDASRIDGS